MAEFWNYTNYHISTPFEAVYDRKSPTVVKYIPGEVKVELVAHELQDTDEALRQLKLHLTRAQEQIKQMADANGRYVTFEVGNWFI